jgi:hypothetical protein
MRCSPATVISAEPAASQPRYTCLRSRTPVVNFCPASGVRNPAPRALKLEIEIAITLVGCTISASSVLRRFVQAFLTVATLTHDDDLYATCGMPSRRASRDRGRRRQNYDRDGTSGDSDNALQTPTKTTPQSATTISPPRHFRIRILCSLFVLYPSNARISRGSHSNIGRLTLSLSLVLAILLAAADIFASRLPV